MKSKEAKIIIRNDTDPEILKWVNTLKYGAFPKIMIEILRWYNKNGLLVRGGANAPDILPPKIPLNQNSESQDAVVLNEILDLLRENNHILKNGTFVPPTETQIESNQPNLSVSQVEHVNKQELEPKQLSESEEEIHDLPMASNVFKIYK